MGTFLFLQPNRVKGKIETSPFLLEIRVERTGRVLASRAQVARSLISRVVGLLGRDSLGEGEGLILTACRSIHTWWMRFAIDAVFVDRAWAVVAIWNSLPPWRMTPFVWRAQAVIELPAGTVGRTHLAVGDRVVVEPAEG